MCAISVASFRCRVRAAKRLRIGVKRLLPGARMSKQARWFFSDLRLGPRSALATPKQPPFFSPSRRGRTGPSTPTPRCFPKSAQSFCFVILRPRQHKQRVKECADCFVSVSYKLRCFAIDSPFGELDAEGVRLTRIASRRGFLRNHYNMWFPQVRAFRSTRAGAILL